MPINYMNEEFRETCPCGKIHKSEIDDVIVGKGVLECIPDIVSRYAADKVFVLADINTYKAAGEKLCGILDNKKIKYSKYVFNETALEPDEYAVGAAVMHFDKECSLLIAVGSGVINDIGKIVSNIANINYVIVATAPSMDGYASKSASMSVNGLKVSLPTGCAKVILGDVDVLKNAPLQMLKAGLGDMIAKYISICEWRIGNMITGEYYCENVAQLIRSALRRCVDNSPKLLQRDEEAIKAVFEGLVIGGAAMAYAGVSRPASGVEHYFSHIWDMRGLEFETSVSLHGIQCAIGTLIAIKLYEKIRKLSPEHQKALDYVKGFDYTNWSEELIKLLGKGAFEMIEIEKKEQKYDEDKHKKRLEIIERSWDKILKIIDEEIPPYEEIERIFDTIALPKTVEEIGLENNIVPLSFKATKDIRDKYVLSRLAWDLGVLDEIV